MRKTKHFLLLAALLLCSFAASADNIASGVCGNNLTWELTDTGELIVGGTGAMGNYTHSYGSYAPWNEYRNSIKTVTILEGVTTIGERAFWSCIYLTSITISESVTSIGYGAFMGCSRLPSIDIPDGVTSIGSYAFEDCTGLTTIIIPNGVTSTGGGTFAGCSSLTSVIISEKLTVIGEYTFAGCSSLTSIKIPDAVARIEMYAFSECSSLAIVTIGKGVTSVNGSSFQKGCNNIHTVINYSPLSISKGSTNCGYVAYYAVKVLNVREHVNVDDFLFRSENGNHYLMGYIGDEVDIELPANYMGDTYMIGSYAFYKCSNLTSVTIPEAVTGIAETNAFSYCIGLTSITLPSSMTSIGGWAFYSCTDLTSITIPENSKLTSIGDCVFQNCSSLTSVTIPKCVTRIGNGAFSGCSNLAEVRITDIGAWCNIDFINYNSNPLYFAGKLYLNGKLATNVVIPNSITELKRYVFYNGSNIASVVIPSSVMVIGQNTFYGCTNLKDVTFEDGDEVCSLYLYQSLFGSSSLERVYVGRNLEFSTTNANYAPFYNQTALETVVIGNVHTAIGSNAFYGCTNLRELTIGSSIASIGNSAFAGCNNLESIYALNPKAITCDVSIFSTDAYNNATLYVPAGREQAYAKTTPWEKFYIQTNHRPLKSFDVTIGSAGYATLFLDYAVERPRGVEAYYVSNVTGNHAVLKAVWDYIPANTGVILRGNAGSYTFAYTAENVAPISENMLRGTVVDAEIPAARNTTYYALGRVDGVVGLYAAKIVDGYFFNNANKAYLPLTTETEEDDDTQLANQFVLRFPNGSTTSLAEVIGDGMAEDAVIYDLQGRRLKEITERGIYIVNGKKVVR